MNGQLVNFSQLPSRGLSYPQDIEIYVRPMSIKEQIDIERYGISDAEYFETILNGITIQGGFRKDNLLHFDVQFLDIVRRLITFDTEDAINIKGNICPNRDCGHVFDYSFRMKDIYFKDFSDDIFNKKFVLGEGTDDEITVTVSPITVREYINMSKEARGKSKKTALSDMHANYMCACIRDVEGREFGSKKERDAFLKDYINNLYRAKDRKVLEQIVDETVCSVEPFKAVCPECGLEVEVVVRPTSNFQQ